MLVYWRLPTTDFYSPNIISIYFSHIYWWHPNTVSILLLQRCRSSRPSDVRFEAGYFGHKDCIQVLLGGSTEVISVNRTQLVATFGIYSYICIYIYIYVYIWHMYKLPTSVGHREDHTKHDHKGDTKETGFHRWTFTFGGWKKSCTSWSFSYPIITASLAVFHSWVCLKIVYP